MSASKRCKTCGKRFKAKQAYINYGRIPLYCSRPCSWEGRRLHRSVAEKKNLKRLYDIEFRKKNRARLKKEKSEYYEAHRTRIEAKMRRVRRTREYKRRMAAYLDKYWAKPGKLETKADYDRRWRARRDYGKLWELKYLTVLINNEVKARMSNYDLRLQNGTLNKAMNRGRNGEVKRGYT